MEGKTSSLGKPQRCVWGGRVGIAIRVSTYFWFSFVVKHSPDSRVFFHFKSIEDMFSHAKRRFHENYTILLLSQLLQETEDNECRK